MTTFDQATKQVLEEARCRLERDPETTSGTEALRLIRSVAAELGVNDLVKLSAIMLFDRAYERRSVTGAMDYAIAELAEKTELASAAEQRVNELAAKLLEARDMLCEQLCQDHSGCHVLICDEITETLERAGCHDERAMPRLALR